jgi:hypothetical protein
MSATYGEPIKGVFMQRQTLADRPDLQEIVADILALRAMSKDGMLLTHKSQRDLVAKLNAPDLAIVARAISAVENANRQQTETQR